MSNYVKLSLMEAKALTLDAWESDPHTPPLWLGPPGIGKTSVAAELATETGRFLSPHEVAHSADEDIGGIPVRDAATGAVVRLPLGPIRAACDNACVYLGDEISRASAQKQGCMLTLANEGRAGDFKLHPNTRVLFAANGTDSAGAHQIIDTLINRCLVIEVSASVDEVKSFLSTRVGDPGTSLRELAIDFAATADKAAGLIQVEPPPGYVEQSAPWASPRAIVKALKVFDRSLQNNRQGDVLFAGLAGLIGKEAAGTYLAIRKVRERLPSVEEIVGNATGAKVPDKADLDANIGTLGLIAIAATRNPDAAWIYAQRIQSAEVGQAITRSMLRITPETDAGRRAKFKMMGKGGAAIAASNS